MLVSEYIEELKASGSTSKEVASILGVSISMVTQYEKGSYNPSLESAKKVYRELKIALHPFGEENLQYEINKEDSK